MVASGPAPQARYMHAAIVSGEKMLVYGGMTEIGTTLNDFWEFDFKRTGECCFYSNRIKFCISTITEYIIWKY